MTGIEIALIVIAALIIIAVIWGVTKRNFFVRLINKVEEAFATIDVYLKKRYDLIPNLLETVKGYMKHERETFESVIRARSSAMGASGDARIDAENQLSGTLKSLFAVAERYPDLKADRQFLELQSQLKAIEHELAQARKYYNAVIKEYNTAILIFPANLIAGMMKLEKRKFFELEDEIERKNVKISFD